MHAVRDTAGDSGSQIGAQVWCWTLSVEVERTELERVAK
jgi:hypothetical protein